MNRVWPFIISKPLSNKELTTLAKLGNEFILNWSAHENKLTASFDIFKERIIVVKVNEDITDASGCSIDKLTRFIKEIETKYKIELLNRLLVAYKAPDKVEIVHSSKIKELLANNIINENTIIYNTSAGNQTELTNWEKELKNTWLNKYLIPKT